MNDKRDKKGLTGAEWFFVGFIILLIVMTGVLAFMINQVGPEEEPYFVIQDVYYEKDGADYTPCIYLTNSGKPSGEAAIEWELTKGDNRLVDKGEFQETVDGRSTEEVTFDFTTEGDEQHTLKIDVLYEGERADYYQKIINP
ncbi:MAG: hypothetical protein ACQESD_02810 [Thermoplasmatota archaeon]